FLVSRLEDDHGYVVQAGLLGGAPAAFARDDLVVVRPHGTDQDRLDDTLFADRGGQVVEVRWIEGLARIARVGAKECDRKPARPAWTARLGVRAIADIADQGREATSKA